MSTPDPAGTDSETPAQSAGPEGEEPQGAVATDAAGSDEDAAITGESGDPDGADGSGNGAAEGSGSADGAETGEDDAGKGDPGDASGEEAAGDGASAPARSSVFDLLPSPVFLLILGITGFAGYFSWTRWEETQDLYTYGGTPYAPFVFIVGAWILSVAVHEFAHALVAYLSGDRGLRGSGYLRLNPLAYRERRIAGTGETGGGVFTGLVMPVVFVVLGGIGLTGPASYVDRGALGGRGRRMLAPLAGIVASLVLAAGFAVAVMLLVPAGMVTDNWLIGGLMFLCYLNLTAALVNLLPIPGLDGYGVFVPLLEAATASPRTFAAMERVARGFGLFGTIAVFAVLWFDTVNMAYINAMTGLFQKIGMPQMDIFFGELLMRFWLS
ncbi:site-2 protease family protein [Nocardiopsis suaedae]|uniref:Site-2 protease family protein n=1 Tax=Nocardiopsis suaedae TaxID=3018444 RepID=A0ABT4TV76_9ACTN|nr:site-2 protease family protein [Nocardiopsis suaedae]MDA2808144.1 site-2 protease family protein [Nocardiopsis suaedae]